MASRTIKELDIAQMPDIGDVFVHHGGAVARHWRVTGLIVQGERRYAVMCDVDDPARSVIVAVADLGAGSPFVRAKRC
jgi:hypothetical protein